jgi:hypothetical protein
MIGLPTRSSTSNRSTARCRPMPTVVTRRFTKLDEWPKQRAGPMPGGSSTNCMLRGRMP